MVQEAQDLVFLSILSVRFRRKSLILQLTTDQSVLVCITTHLQPDLRVRENQVFRELDGSRAPRALCVFQIGSFLVTSRRHLFGCDLRSPKTLMVISSNFSSNSVGKSLVTLGGGEFGWYGDGGADWEGWLWVRMPLVSLHPDTYAPLTCSILQQPSTVLADCNAAPPCISAKRTSLFWDWAKLDFDESGYHTSCLLYQFLKGSFFTDDLRFQCFSISERNLQFRASGKAHLVLNTYSLSLSLSLRVLG